MHVVAAIAASFIVPCLVAAGGGEVQNRHLRQHHGILSSRLSYAAAEWLQPRHSSPSSRSRNHNNPSSSSSSSSSTQLQQKHWNWNWNWKALNKDLQSYHHRSLAFGDYVDPSFSCPATVTCNVVCVANITDCPADALCPGTHPNNDKNAMNHTYELCADGTCADTTAGQVCDPDAVSPCSCEGLPLACAKQVDLLPECSTRFQAQYDANTECLELQTESLPQVNFTGPWFMACYVGLSTVTILMLVWCAYNQRWARVKGSTVPLESPSLATKNEEDSGMNENHEWSQTGYKTTFVGMILYALIILAHWIIQFLLFALVVEFYVQQEAITTSIFGSQQFFDQVQLLMAFIITWMVGFVWCFFLRVPASIHSIFLRRCIAESATYVAVTIPVKIIDDKYKNMYARFLLVTISRIWSFLALVFSDESLHSAQGWQNKVTYCKVKTDAKTGTRYFYFRFRRYIYDDTVNKFIPGFFDVIQGSISYGSWLDNSYLHQGLSQEEATRRLGIVGPNVLDLKKPMLISAILAEFSKPFYLYQTFMIWIWAPLWYYYMAIVATCVRVTGGLVVAFFKYMGDKSLYQLLVTDGTVEVLRGGELMTMDQTDVVPGDIIRLVPGLAFFDMAILQASALLVDESALTGEVHPVAKMPLDPASADHTYNSRSNKSSTISAGTSILECGEGAGKEGDLAIVTKTGSFTSKGELLSDVLSFERHKFKFDTEVKLVLVILVIEAMIMSSVVLSVVQDNWVYSWFYAMFVVVNLLPPLLPTVFVVSVGISCKRLQEKKISCTESSSILVAGKVKKACFDKTGTLTRQGLEYLSSDEIDEESFSLKRGLAVCQTLNLSNDGDLIGRTVDRMGFASTSAEMVGQNTIRHDGVTYRYLKRFEFDHHRMTQSVIVKHGDEAVVYVKGSPEAIRKLCVPASLPSDFSVKTRQSAREGIYQLAMATSVFTSKKSLNEVTRDDIERDLDFVGFVNFENRIKEDSPAVIHELRSGKVDCVMITGDNVLTGIHIAIQAGIIDPDVNVVIGNSIQSGGEVEWINAKDDSPAKLSENTSMALTGEVWDYVLKNDPTSALEFAKRTQVFGRCTPNDKVSIVSTFAGMGEIVLMCGDGGNDCGALKAAHVGIALSDAEASVVAPFTSLEKSILSVTEVLREGRCALASALACYKYIIMYGQVESIIQVVSAYLHVVVTEWCWVFMDGIWTLSMAFSLPLAKAAKNLSKFRPTASILGPHTLSSACGVLAINFLFLVSSLLLLWQQDWFACRRWDSTDVSDVRTIGDNYESSVIFSVAGYQYISSAAAFNFGYSFRSAWYRNYVFVFFFLLWTSFQFTATLTASRFSCIWRLNCDNNNVVRFVTEPHPVSIHNIFNTTVMPIEFRGKLVVLMIANLILNCSWDYFVVNWRFVRRSN